MMVRIRGFPNPLEVSMKRAFTLLLAFFALSVLGAQAASTASTGWISDSMCQAKHVHGTAADKACVAKCIQSGMKPVFVDSKKEVWSIDNPSAVNKTMYGAHVRVTVNEDAANKSVHIDSIRAAR
jgi:hypothetical protein